MSAEPDDPNGLDINGRCADLSCTCQPGFAKKRSLLTRLLDALVRWLRKDH